jgi:hypothetical protein
MRKYELEIYTTKIKQPIQQAMMEFTDGECYLVKRRKKGKTSEGQRGQCHMNVDGWVQRIGGKRIAGWLLERSNALMVKGIWIWSFHSVWKTPEGEIVDVTRDPTYEGKDFTTVWFDARRDVDFKKGTSFNNIVIFENKTAAAPFGHHFRRQIEHGVPYWVTPSFDVIAEISEHSGIYRWINSSYPKNRERFTKEYDCKIVNGRIVPNGDPNRKVESKMLLDYAVGC